jgi:hypothetical protein
VGDRILRAVDGLNCCKSIYLAVPLGSAKRQDFTAERPLHLVSEAGRNRFEEYVSVRRAHLNSLGSILRVSVTLLRIVGFRRSFPLDRVIVGLRARDRGDPDRALSALEGVDRLLPSLVEEKFGLRVGLVTVREPGLALDFDYVEQLKLLEEWGAQHRPTNL